MKLFRNYLISRILALFTAVVFLNLTFILTEINTFELKQKDSALYDSITKMVSGIGAEEESDLSDENESLSEKEVKMYCLQSLLTSNFYLMAKGLHSTEFSLRILSGNPETTTPPPKLS